MPRALRKQPHRFWLLAFILALALTVSEALNQSAPAKYAALCGLLGVGAFLLVPAALHLCSSLFLAWARSVGSFVVSDDANELVDWYNAAMQCFEGSAAMYVVGAALGALAELAYIAGGYFDGFTVPGKTWAGVMVFASAFLAGCGLWATYSASAAVYAFGERFRERILVQPGRFGVLSTGRVLAQCWMIISAVWFVYTLSALFGPPFKSLDEVLMNYPVILVAAPIFPFVVGCFIGCQLPIHAAMVEFKRRELRYLDEMLRALKPTSVADLSKDRQERIDFLLKRRSETETLPEWPFSSKALAAVSSSVVSAMLPVLAKGLLPAQVMKQLAPLIGD